MKKNEQLPFFKIERPYNLTPIMQCVKKKTPILSPQPWVPL